VTGNKGDFSIVLTSVPDTLIISHIGYIEKRVIIPGPSEGPLTVALKAASTELQEVTISTGYQNIPKERATGSFDFIDNKLLNRSVSPDILSRLKGVTSGLLFDRTASNDLNISIRGRSTLFANTQPLIVLNNFVYDGNINNINPNDIESITVLKDAAAASIWGARSGNGVIVITTKKGSYNTPVKVSFNSNVTVSGKPDLFYPPAMSSADYITVEKYLFNEGYYDYTLTDPNEPAVTPVVEILNNERNGTITAQQANAQIKALQGHYVRNDLLKYIYREPVNQQYAVNLKGGARNNRYYISLGYDHDLNALIGNTNGRLSVNANNVYSLIKHKLEITTGIIFTKTNKENNGLSPALIGGTSILYPYAQLVDSKGNALPIAQYRQGYIDTAGDGKLLDWNYRPLDEMRNGDNHTYGTDYQANIGISYKIVDGLSASVKYKYASGEDDRRVLNSEQMYSTRNLINEFTENTPTGLTYPVPLGAILDLNNSSYTSQNLRAQINYDHTWKGDNQLTAIAGTEIKDLSSGSSSYTYYGYDATHETSVPVDFVNFYPNYITGSEQQISNGQSFLSYADRYLSYYLNAAYTYNNKYTLSISGRRDASNLFGVKTNQKWVPLWSSGVAWDASGESFYHINWLPKLKLRITYGYNGNIDKNVTAFLTSRLSPYPNDFGEPNATIVNPPNPDLSWEKVKVVNAGVDFGTKNNRISGSIEFYIKNGLDLIGNEQLPPSTGISGAIKFMGNSANTQSHGIDLVLNSRNIVGKFNWNTSFLLSWEKNKVTSYRAQIASINSYVVPFGLTPKVGGPITALYSYKWAGLDSVGNPKGYLDGKVSEDYTSIMSSSNFSNLVYSGSSAPTIFGGLLNTFNWHQVSLSFDITYKLGYYFRRTSIDYSDLFGGASPGHKDFDKRWQHSGDEKRTNVPSMIYPANNNRGQFYSNSSTLVTRGDHVRLQNIQLNYTFNQKQLRSIPCQNIRVYVYADNLGILWRANKYGIDPDYASSLYTYPPSKGFAAGINIDF
jgi:TonB-linked SusC/RagA family outer membrane protein